MTAGNIRRCTPAASTASGKRYGNNRCRAVSPMREFLCTAFSILLLLCAGCASQESNTPGTFPSASSNTTATEDIDNASNAYSPPEVQAEGPGEVPLTEEIWLPLAEQYKTDYCFTDLDMPGKLWLVGTDNIIQVLSTGGVVTVTVIRQTAIVRTESMLFEEYAIIEVVDKTNQSISILTAPANADTLHTLLPPK